MEGPTPVSSLLHSCTLVMAGIFVIFGSTISILQNLVITLFLLSISLVVVALAPTAEKDFKRTIAGSTAIMVSFIFLILFKSFSSTALLVSLYHASYKSALFLATGKVLNHSSIYGDHTFSSRTFSSSIFLISLFLLGLRGSVYGASKHAVDAGIFSGLDVTTNFVVGAGIFIV